MTFFSADNLLVNKEHRKGYEVQIFDTQEQTWSPGANFGFNSQFNVVRPTTIKSKFYAVAFHDGFDENEQDIRPRVYQYTAEKWNEIGRMKIDRRKFGQSELVKRTSKVFFSY